MRRGKKKSIRYLMFEIEREKSQVYVLLRGIKKRRQRDGRESRQRGSDSDSDSDAPRRVGACEKPKCTRRKRGGLRLDRTEKAVSEAQVSPTPAIRNPRNSKNSVVVFICHDASLISKHPSTPTNSSPEAEVENGMGFSTSHPAPRRCPRTRPTPRRGAWAPRRPSRSGTSASPSASRTRACWAFS